MYRKEVNKGTQEVSWTFKHLFIKVFIPVMALSIIIGGISWVIGIARQPARVIGKVLDADNILYNYEWFKQAYQDFNAINIKIDNAKEMASQFVISAGERTGWGFEDKNEYSRLNTIVLGLQNQREDIVATYNARSAMASKKIFKTGELPDRLE